MKNIYEKPPVLPSAEDYHDNPVIYGLLKRLPQELAIFHINKCEQQSLDDEEMVKYLKEVLEKREAVTRESEISDEEIAKFFTGREEEIFNALETDIFLSSDNFLGAGMTAKVKLYTVEDENMRLPIAVKYLLTPTAKTLSASGEHDMIKEVERITTIESIEKKDVDKLKNIRVPHPYFHHKNEHVQCYGMEYIDGLNLEEAIARKWTDSTREALYEAFKTVSLEDVLTQVDIFYDNMHEYCLHGDIKPANIMVNTKGEFLIIDFGQSILISHIPDKAQEQLYTLREDERKMTKDSIKRFFDTLQ